MFTTVVSASAPKRTHNLLLQDTDALVVFADTYDWSHRFTFAFVAANYADMVAQAAVVGLKWFHGYNIKTGHWADGTDNVYRPASVGYIARLGQHGANGLHPTLHAAIAKQTVTVARARSC